MSHVYRTLVFEASETLVPLLVSNSWMHIIDRPVGASGTLTPDDWAVYTQEHGFYDPGTVIRVNILAVCGFR